jgi:glucose-fructose oxidoreductase
MPRFIDSKRTHLAAIVSGNPEKLARIGDAYGLPADARYGYDRFGEIARDRRVDAVYIVLPTGLHAEWTEKAFAAGKHVLCEKPMALTSAECSRMIAAAERARRKLMIAYRCHFEPFNRTAMQLMREGVTGPLRLIRTEQSYRMGPTDPSRNWRVNRALAGGGPLEDYGLYGIQSAIYLSGEMPEAIAARTVQPAGDPRFAEIFSQVASQWRFPSGATAQLFTSYDSHGSNLAHAKGAKAALIMEPATNYSGNTLRIEGEGARILNPGDPMTQFAAQLDHFAEAIRDNRPILTPGEMGLRDLRIIEATYAAARTGNPVTLNPDGTMRG